MKLAGNGVRDEAKKRRLQETPWKQGEMNYKKFKEDISPSDRTINPLTPQDDFEEEEISGINSSESLLELADDPEDGYFSTERQLATGSESDFNSWSQYKSCRRQLFHNSSNTKAISSKMMFAVPGEGTPAIESAVFQDLKPLPSPSTEKAVLYWQSGTDDSSETMDFEDRQLDGLKSLLFVPYDDQQDDQFMNTISNFNQLQGQDQTPDLRTFRCKTCGARFKFRQWLKAHEQRHLGNQFPCGFCGKMFLRKILLKLHLSRHNQWQHKKQLKPPLSNIKRVTKLPKNSPHLDQGTKNKKQLKKQYQSVQAVRRQKVDVFKCPHCPKTYRSQAGFNNHRRVHTGKMFTCPHCSKKFVAASYLSLHVKDKHRHEIVASSGSGKNSNEGSQDSPSAHPESQEFEFECNICFSKFKTSGDLRMHRKVHSGGNPYECFICGLKFQGEAEFQFHRKAHTTASGNLFDCHICGNEFTKKASLQYHMKAVHYVASTKASTFQCAHCTKVFSRLVNLRNHEKTHSESSTALDRSTSIATSFQCPVCHKSFTRKSYLEQHMLSYAHNGEKPFKCTLCGKHFKTKQGSEEHLLFHTGEKPFKCSMCSLSFARKETLKLHERNHTDMHPFKCFACGCSFSTENGLRTHRNRSHRT